MSNELLCYRCGVSLSALTLPLSRYDECPSCAVHLRVCRMCENFAADVPRKCTEDDAEEVTEKERLNFCEWFTPGTDVYSGKEAKDEARAKNNLSELFGDAARSDPENDADSQAAEDLFK